MNTRSACLAHSQNVDSSLFFPEECFLHLVFKQLSNPTILHSSLKTNIINVPGVLWLFSKVVLFFLSLSTHNYYSFVLSFLSSAASVPFHGVPGACSRSFGPVTSTTALRGLCPSSVCPSRPLTLICLVSVLPGPFVFPDHCLSPPSPPHW